MWRVVLCAFLVGMPLWASDLTPAEAVVSSYQDLLLQPYLFSTSPVERESTQHGHRNATPINEEMLHQIRCAVFKPGQLHPFTVSLENQREPWLILGVQHPSKDTIVDLFKRAHPHYIRQQRDVTIPPDNQRYRLYTLESQGEIYVLTTSQVRWHSSDIATLKHLIHDLYPERRTWKHMRLSPMAAEDYRCIAPPLETIKDFLESIGKGDLFVSSVRAASERVFYVTVERPLQGSRAEDSTLTLWFAKTSKKK